MDRFYSVKTFINNRVFWDFQYENNLIPIPFPKNNDDKLSCDNIAIKPTVNSKWHIFDNKEQAEEFKRKYFNE